MVLTAPATGGLTSLHILKATVSNGLTLALSIMPSHLRDTTTSKLRAWNLSYGVLMPWSHNRFLKRDARIISDPRQGIKGSFESLPPRVLGQCIMS